MSAFGTYNQYKEDQSADCWKNAAAQAADSVITLRGDQPEVVSHYKYLGSVFTSDCTSDAETLHGVAAANSVFQQLRRANIWSSRALTLYVKTEFLSMHSHVSAAIL